MWHLKLLRKFESFFLEFEILLFDALNEFGIVAVGINRIAMRECLGGIDKFAHLLVAHAVDGFPERFRGLMVVARLCFLAAVVFFFDVLVGSLLAHVAFAQ